MNNVIEQLIQNYNPRNSEEVKNAFSNICRKTFVMVAGRELHYYLTPVQHSLGSTFMIGKEEFHSQDVNSWLENNKNSKLHISGTVININLTKPYQLVII